VIVADGRMDGFVGGACSREIVRRQGLEALSAREPRLVQIRPEGAPAGFAPHANHVVIPMSCASEGAEDVYIEPYAPAPLLVIAGFSPVAEALAGVAQALEWDCARVVSAEEATDLAPSNMPVVTLDGIDEYLNGLAAAGRPLDAAVVASQGHYDELALEALLGVPPGYLGLIASRKRGAAVRDLLIEGGARPAAVGGIHNPAGLEIGATTPGDVAVSIMAQIVQCRHTGSANASAQPCPIASAPAGTPALAMDPVCHMEVAMATAMHTTVHEGATYYFCCAHCKIGFAQDPTRYLVPMGPA